HRFDFEPITLDSYSGRVTYNPTAQWSFTAGYGFLKRPERLDPAESMHRAVASALFGRKLGDDGQLSATAVCGANTHHGHRSHSLLLESEAIMNATHTVFGRAELV